MLDAAIKDMSGRWDDSGASGDYPRGRSEHKCKEWLEDCV